MASTKLTNEIRDAVQRKVVGRVFAEAETDLAVERSRFADAVYAALYDEKMLRLMARIPSVFTEKAARFRVQLGPEYVQLEMPKIKPFPVKHLQGCIEVFDNKHELTVRYEKICQSSDKLREDRNQYSREVRQVLYSVNTTKQLLEIWPAVEEFLPVEASERANLPAVVVTKVDRRLKSAIRGSASKEGAAA